MDSNINDPSDEGSNNNRRPTKTDFRRKALAAWYKDKTPVLMQLLSSRGNNTFDNVTVRASAANNCSSNTRSYLRQLSDSLTLEKPFTSDEAVSIVSSIRTICNLPPFTGNVRKQCLDELLKVFIIRTVIIGPTGNTRQALVAKFKLLAE